MMYDGNLAEAVCITSPGYPSGYAPNLICRWDVLEDDLFTWTEDFDTERGFDYVWVTSSGTVVGGSYYSGDMDIHEIPPDATLGTGNAIHFYTDSSGSGRGFKMCGARSAHPVRSSIAPLGCVGRYDPKGGKRSRPLLGGAACGPLADGRCVCDGSSAAAARVRGRGHQGRGLQRHRERHGVRQLVLGLER
jgi:hypothetical protein